MELKIPKTQYLRIKVIPKSNKTELVEIMESPEDEKTYKIRIKAAPEKNRANTELINFLSKELSVPKDNIAIISGKTEPLKLIRVKF